MLVWSINHVNQFLELTNFIVIRGNYYNRMIFKYSRKSFSTMVSSSSPICITELQIMPQFFPFFFCTDQIFQYSTISITQFYPSLFLMSQNGFSFMIFSLSEALDNFLGLKFLSSSGHDQWEASLPLLLSYQEFDVGVINYGCFVSIESVHFRACLSMFDHNTYVRVSMSNSQLRLASGRQYIILHQQRGECIIGGVRAGEITHCLIIMNPIASFFSLINSPKAKRVWLFKSNNSVEHGVITVPIHLYAQYLVYSN